MLAQTSAAIAAPAAPEVPDSPARRQVVEHRSVSANGIRVHLAEAGTGPLVILLPGFGQVWSNWRHQLAGLAAAGFRAVALDLRGTGDSDKTPRGYDAFTLAADVAGLIRALGARRAALVGHGYGGTLAFNTAVLHPDLIDAVVAIAAPHPARMAGLRRVLAADRYGRLVVFAALPFVPDRRLAAQHGAMLERLVREQAGPDWLRSPDFADDMAAMRDAIGIPGAAKGAIEMLRWVGRSPWRADGFRHREALAHPLIAPVLHLVGDLDTFTPPAVLASAEEYCAGSYELRVVPGVGHYPAEEAPAAVTDAIVGFLRRQQPR